MHDEVPQSSREGEGPCTSCYDTQLVAGFSLTAHVLVSEFAVYNQHYNDELAKQVKSPMGWRHAELDDVREFLRAEIVKGRFKPVFDAPL